MKVKAGIYAIKNIQTGKVYVGSSGSVKRRWKGHRTELRGSRHHAAPLQKAWDTYGEDAFVFGVIEWCPKEELEDREQIWLDHYESYRRKCGYNVAKSAISPMLGRSHSAEARELIGQQSRERYADPTAHPMYGKPRSEECKRKISRTKKAYYRTHDGPNMGKTFTPEFGEKQSKLKKKWHAENDHPMLGKTHTEEARQKISEAGKGRTPWNKGVPLREETKRKLSQSLKGRELSERHRAKISQQTRGAGNPSAKLTRKDVLEILETYDREKISQKKLGDRFGVSQAQIYHIVNGKSWHDAYQEYQKNKGVTHA